MNPVLDTLKTRRSVMLLGHGLAVLATAVLARLAFPLGRAFDGALLAAAVLAVYELAVEGLDPGLRILRKLGPGAFPFKALPEGDRELLQRALLAMPRKSAWQALGAWCFVFGAMEWGNQGVWGMAALSLGLPVSVFVQLCGNTVMGRRVAPFYYFEGDTPSQLSPHMPDLEGRMAQWLLAPLIAITAFPMAFSAAGIRMPMGVWPWLLLWALALVAAAIRVFKDMVVSPLEDLGQALGRFGEGDFGALLDVTSGDALGVASNRHNKTVRKIDRRFFVREHFGHMVVGERTEQLLEGGIRLDGEERDLAVLVCRLSGEAMSLPVYNKFCGVVMECVDRHAGSLDEVGQGLVVALFNAPLTIENAETVGMEAAQELRERLRIFVAQQRMQSGRQLEFGVGFAYGRAVVGLAGPKGRQRYTALGSVVEEARRQSFL
jgi:hypothetical protein